MCGIVGGVYWEHEPDRERLEHAISLLHHRGPDEQGVFIKNKVALGHARLSIIDLSGGRQPLHSKDGNLHLVANGEIYNYLEIDGSLRGKVDTPLSRSDSEAIMQVYQHAGSEGFKDLYGMFAFALYDEARDALILCRDRLGIKPLYYAETSRGFFFSSEIKSLLPLLEKSPQINPDALVQFLQNQFHTGRETIFDSVKRVMPGEYLVVRNRQISFFQYWTVTDVQPRELTLDQAFEEFEPLFDQVMREHMRSDVPFGLFLSGGIDSSVLLAELSKLQDKELKTFSIGYAGVNMKDELDAAGELARTFNTNHHSLRVTRDDLFERIVHTIWAADDLMRDYASLPTLLLSDEASKELKIVFSGEAGDEVFAGYRRYAPTIERWLNHKLLGRGIRSQGQWNKLSREKIFTGQLKNMDPGKPFADVWSEAPGNWSLMKKRQYVDLKTALVDNLFVKTDRMMMAFGLEGRVPFADHRIVEFGFSLPDKLKYQNGRGKWIIRKWAEKYLPREHLQKPKRGFYVPVKEWLSGEFAKKLGDKLLANKAINAWFNVEGVKQILAAHAGGKNYSREIWGLMQFAIWYRLFVEQPGIVPGKKENPLDWL